MAWGVAVMLVLAAASVKAEDLHLDVMEDELLGGEYLPNNSNSSWYIKFSAKVEGDDIVSVCGLWSIQEDYLAEVTVLKIPYWNKHTSKIDHMHARMIAAAKATAQVLKQLQLLPATIDDIVEAYWNMADILANKTKDMGNNQVRYAVMYHSIIIRAALRIIKGARKTEDICQASPDYEYTESTSLFICTQDLPNPQHSQSPAKHRQRRNDCGRCFAPWYRFGHRLCGHDWGCCGNYHGCCYYAHGFCWLHDRVCRCCRWWWCGWQCHHERGC